MNFQFPINKEDCRKSLKEYFRYLFLPAFTISFIFALIISYSVGDWNREISDFNWKNFLISFVICILVFLYFYWGRKYLKSFKALKKFEEKDEDFILNIRFLEDGIRFKRMGTEVETIKKWGEFKRFFQSKEFTNFHFTDGTYLFVKNESLIKDNEEFVPIIQEKIKPFTSEMGKTLIWYSFIPLIGFIFGFLFFVRGIFDRHLKNFFIGILSFIFSVITFWCFTYFMDVTGKNTGSDTYKNKNNLNQIVKELAYYKLKNGKIPETLDSLKIQNNFLILVEVETYSNPFSDVEIRDIYYENRDSTFVLRTLGPDGKPFTEDDVLPDY